MVVFYISAHGFGHASRSIEVINVVLRQRPDLALTVRSAVPPWLFETAAERALDLHAVATDTGLAQVGSLRIDEGETARLASKFYERFETRVAAEAAWLRRAGATLVVADVPPLACAAAARAGIPSIVLANFTWDWIYRAFEGFDRDAPGVLDIIEQAYSTTTSALRLPLHGGFAPMADVVRDIPFIARRSRQGRGSARASLEIETTRPVVLASFGGHGAEMPYDKVAADGRVLVVLTSFEASANAAVPDHEHVRCLTQADLAARHLRYEDLVAAADVVMSKPGYGIVSECVANGTSLLYTSRGRMAEYDVFVDEMPQMLRCRYIPQDEVMAGHWADAVEALLAQPPAPTTPMINGAEVAAGIILKTAR